MFVFATCQVGAERVLKDELAQNELGLKFAFSRPGFLTFKTEKELPPDFSLKSVFGRGYGISLGKADFLAVLAEAEKLRAQAAPHQTLRLHVFERDQYAPSEEPKGYEAGRWAKNWSNQWSEKYPQLALFSPQPKAEIGDLVLDVIAVEENEAWVGYHLHTSEHSPFPGGLTPIELPVGAPSRAYLKLEEAIAWSNAPLQSGDTAVEIGSAPGGAVFSLLRRGLTVVGIDPGKMDRIVMNHPAFTHVETQVSNVPRESLPESIEWLLMDMNVEPRISMFAVDRLATRMRSTLLGVILTIKLNDWKMAREIPKLLEHLKAMGMVRVRAAQLSHFRQEISIVGFTRKGLSRRTRA